MISTSDETAFCETCHNAIIAMPLWERALSRICWTLAMHWPYRWFMSKPHAAILPWAGNYAYRCFCRRSTPHNIQEGE